MQKIWTSSAQTNVRHGGRKVGIKSHPFLRSSGHMIPSEKIRVCFCNGVTLGRSTTLQGGLQTCLVGAHKLDWMVFKVSEGTPVKESMWPARHELNKEDTSEHAKLETEKSPWGLNTTMVHKELLASEEGREMEKWSFPGKSMPIFYPVPNGQPWKHTYKLYYADWIGYI